jgi:hypothetical protein
MRLLDLGEVQDSLRCLILSCLGGLGVMTPRDGSYHLHVIASEGTPRFGAQGCQARAACL